MNEHRTASILQRLSVILAVTATSYGLPAQAQTQRSASRVASTLPESKGATLERNKMLERTNLPELAALEH